jgi:hypothetical protein
MKQTTLEKYRTPRKEKRKQQEANPVTELAVPMAVVNGASTSAPLPRSTNGPSATTETSTLRGRSEGALLPPVEIYDTTSEEEEIDSPTKPRITTHNDVRASKMAQAATTPSACSKGKRPADAEEENYSDFSSGAEEEVVALMERPVGKTPCTLGIRTPPQTKGKLPTRRVLFSKTEMSGPSTSNTSKRQCLGNGSTPCNSFSAALINLTTASLPSSTAREPHAELTQEVMHLLKDTAVSDPVRQTVRNALEKHAAQTKRLKARVAELQAQVENLEQTSQTIKAKLLTIYQEL